MAGKQYKAFNFDLSVRALQENYPGTNYRQAYQDIRQFLEDNGFEHRQGSGYRSINEMSDIEVTLLVVRLGRSFPWLGKCVKHFDVTNIGSNYDLCDLLINPRGMDLGLYDSWLKQTSLAVKKQTHRKQLRRDMER